MAMPSCYAGNKTFSCVDLVEYVNAKMIHPDECFEITGKAILNKIANSDQKIVHPFFQFLVDHHQPAYEGNFLDDALLALNEATERLNEVNKAKTSSPAFYKAIDSAAISYTPDSGDQYYHIDEKSYKQFETNTVPVRSCLQACSDNTTPTAVAKHQPIFEKKTSITDLIYITSKQAESLINCKRFYPTLEHAFTSLTATQRNLPRQILQDNIPLLHLPCFVEEDNIELFNSTNLTIHIQEPIKKQKRTQRTIGTRVQQGIRPPPKPIAITPKRHQILQAKTKAKIAPPNTKMKLGDYLIMPGGRVHKGRADPGKTKIYYTFRPEDMKEMEEYKHEEQIDALEVWVTLCTQIWPSLSIDERHVIFRHILTAYMISLCSQFQFYSRFYEWGMLFHNFQLLDDEFWGKYGNKPRGQPRQTWSLGLKYKGNKLPNDPSELFTKTTEQDTSQPPRYQLTKQATDVWNLLYTVADKHKMWEIQDLFSDKTTALKIQRFLNINQNTRTISGHPCYALDEAGAMLIQLPKDGILPKDLVEFTKCTRLSTQVIQLANPKLKNYYIYSELMRAEDTEENNNDPDAPKTLRVQTAVTETDIPQDAILIQDDMSLENLLVRLMTKHEQEGRIPTGHKRKRTK